MGHSLGEEISATREVVLPVYILKVFPMTPSHHKTQRTTTVRQEQITPLAVRWKLLEPVRAVTVVLVPAYRHATTVSVRTEQNNYATFTEKWRIHIA